MRLYFAPALVFGGCILFYLALVVWVIVIATSQPWLGVTLGSEAGSVVVTQVNDASTVAPQFLGQTLVSIEGLMQSPLYLTPLSLIEEPDVIASVEGLKEFYTQQALLFQALRSGQVSLTFASGETQTVFSGDVQSNRPIASLPLKFWTQLSVGFVGMVIGTWLVSLRSRDLAAWMVLVAGVGLALSSGSAALYSSREVALSYTVFKSASHINSTGTLLFGIGMLTLFLLYPRLIVPRYILLLPALFIGSVIVVMQGINWPQYVPVLHGAVATVMLALLVAIGVQAVINRHDPAARAMLGWLGVSIALGAGGFVLTTILPTLLGQEVWVAQSTAFLFFLLIYAGITLGVARYRLFDLAAWSFGVLFYGFGVALLLLLDAALIYFLSVDRAPAFGISLAVIGSIYLPLRGHVARWFHKRNTMSAEELYRRITEVPHSIDPHQKQAVLIKLWDDLFSPLSIKVISPSDKNETRLEDNGAAMALAPVFGLPGLRLTWARQGARLFSSKDLLRAKTINSFIDTSLRQNQIYLDAIETERSRINRDMHDNIGVMLASALHVANTERKNELIRQTLKDLREIIANPDQHFQQLPQLIADLRAEASGYLEAAEITVEWDYSGLPEMDVEPLVVQTLRALIREGTNNVVRHSRASKMTIHLSYSAPDLTVTLHDNGQGFDEGAVSLGNGLRNLANRVAQLDGSFDVKRDQPGTTIMARLPLEKRHRRLAG